MALYIGDTLIAGNIDGQQLNNPFSLLDYKYSEYALDNASWLLSNGQFNSGATYSAVYNLLLAIYNGTTTKAGVSVKLSTETYAGTDFVLNTSDTTFRLPLKVALASGKAVVGNGNAMALTTSPSTDPESTAATHYFFESPNNSSLTGNEPYVTTPLPNGTTAGTYGGFENSALIGLSPNPTISGIETSASGLYLYFYVGETVQDANIIAAAGVLTDVADLKAHSIVETYVNGTSWYRVYSDGWCEQGGRFQSNDATNTTVTFLKPYKDTNYTPIVGHMLGSAGASTYWNWAIYSMTNSTMVIHNATDGNTNSCVWQACGYIR